MLGRTTPCCPGRAPGSPKMCRWSIAIVPKLGCKAQHQDNPQHLKTGADELANAAVVTSPPNSISRRNLAQPGRTEFSIWCGHHTSRISGDASWATFTILLCSGFGDVHPLRFHFVQYVHVRLFLLRVCNDQILLAETRFDVGLIVLSSYFVAHIVDQCLVPPYIRGCCLMVNASVLPPAVPMMVSSPRCRIPCFLLFSIV